MKKRAKVTTTNLDETGIRYSYSTVHKELLSGEQKSDICLQYTVRWQFDLSKWGFWIFVWLSAKLWSAFFTEQGLYILASISYSVPAVSDVAEVLQRPNGRTLNCQKGSFGSGLSGKGHLPVSALSVKGEEPGRTCCFTGPASLRGLNSTQNCWTSFSSLGTTRTTGEAQELLHLS